jgi:ATP-dependent DNA helicase RecG
MQFRIADTFTDSLAKLTGEHQPISREDINKLLLDKLPDVLNKEQRIDKIHNLISSLAGKKIRNIGSRRIPKWVLIDEN